MMRYKRVIYLLFCFTLILFSCETPLVSETIETVKVIKVVDGDSIDIQYSDGKEDRVRMVGIDTPETYGENDPDKYNNIGNTDYLKAWGQAASQYSQDVLLGQAIEIRYDSIAGERGYYGRLLAYVILNGQNYNKEFVKQGFARVYIEGDCEFQGDLIKLESEAQSKRVGVWSGRFPK